MGAKYKLYIKVSDDGDGVEIKEFRRSDSDYPLHVHFPYDLAEVAMSFARPMQILATAIQTVCEIDSPDAFEGDRQLYEAALKCIEFWEVKDDELNEEAN
jgi:hypothetical protein